jgi:hypothetical protein
MVHDDGRTDSAVREGVIICIHDTRKGTTTAAAAAAAAAVEIIFVSHAVRDIMYNAFVLFTVACSGG